MLGPMKLQIEAPVAYDHYLEDFFKAATSSCHASGYSYTTPGPYALNSTTQTISDTATATSTEQSSSICVGDTVTVKDGDSCESIAAANGVSRYGLLSLNNLDVYCSNIAAVTSLCLPQKCPTYTVARGDSCRGLASSHNISSMELVWWNGNLEGCFNMDRWVNWTICVG